MTKILPWSTPTNGIKSPLSSTPVRAVVSSSPDCEAAIKGNCFGEGQGVGGRVSVDPSLLTVHTDFGLSGLMGTPFSIKYHSHILRGGGQRLTLFNTHQCKF